MDQGVLLFGNFKLKSGRDTPYFFNLGNVSTGESLLKLGRSYANCILQHGLKPDVLFGPAYKGISLAVTTAIGLAEKGVNVGVAFNRKETKDRGEGGRLIGSPLQDKQVLVIDDVIVNGAAKIESIELIQQQGGQLLGIVVAIDRCEYLEGTSTAAEVLSETLQTSIYSVVSLHDVVGFLEQDVNQSDNLAQLRRYAASHCKGFEH